ncbi:hypothetical protein LGFCKLCI_00008 [Klebsiella phage vB_KpnM_SCNJ1-Y]|nr:hypothetical protein LGFCKLCI_00008 [Klebsiella phage vB_KpnM_SCNJ1-Y]
MITETKYRWLRWVVAKNSRIDAFLFGKYDILRLGWDVLDEIREVPAELFGNHECVAPLNSETLKACHLWNRAKTMIHAVAGRTDKAAKQFRTEAKKMKAEAESIVADRNDDSGVFFHWKSRNGFICDWSTPDVVSGNKKDIVYVIRSECGKFVKVGITSTGANTDRVETVVKSFREYTGTNAKLVKLYEVQSGDAYRIESEVHRKLGGRVFGPSKLFDGSTEWFRWSDDVIRIVDRITD